MDRRNSAFLGIVSGVFLILYFSKVFQHGLFFDGLIYSSLSNNLSNGIGSFWDPQFSATIYPHFFEHPPLVFGLQSFFMDWFDGVFFSEKVYAFLMACLVVLFLGLIWRKINPSPRWRHLFWLPVLFWIITPKNSWAFNNNLLENTMTVLSIASVYFLLVAVGLKGVKRYALIVLTAVLLFLAFLAKGFPGLFPLGLFFLYGLVFKEKYSLKHFFLDTAVLSVAFTLIFLSVFYTNEAALHNLSVYLDTQVFGSITGKNRVGSRLVLMKNLFNELIPLLIISAIILGVFAKKIGAVFAENKVQLKWALFFLLMGLSASVPLMVSLKISSFYLIPALPYFDLAFAFVLSAFVLMLVERLAKTKIGYAISIALGGVALIVGITLSVLNVNTVGRDHDLFNDMFAMDACFKDQKTVSLHPSYHNDWTTIAYFQRYLDVSFERGGEPQHFYLIPKGEGAPENYQKVDLPTLKFDLLQRTD